MGGIDRFVCELVCELACELVWQLGPSPVQALALGIQVLALRIQAGALRIQAGALLLKAGALLVKMGALGRHARHVFTGPGSLSEPGSWSSCLRSGGSLIMQGVALMILMRERTIEAGELPRLAGELTRCLVQLL